jgi:hypothetical protein
MMEPSGQARQDKRQADGVWQGSKKVLTVSENEQPAGSGAAASDEPGGPAEPVTPSVPPAADAAPPGSGGASGSGGGPRAGGARRLSGVLTSRAAGWAAAAVLAGALVAVSVTGLTTPSVTGLITPSAARIAVRVPAGAAGQIRVLPALGQVRVAAPLQGVIVMPGRVFPAGPAGRVLAGPFGQVAAGTVGSVSSSSFTITTAAGQQVTVTEQPSTAYRKAGSPATASAVTRGETVAVLGSLNGSHITATVVAVLAAN